MTWNDDHSMSEKLAAQAHLALQSGKQDDAVQLFVSAAEYETSALGKVNPQKARTFGVTAISAAALWFKAGEFSRTEQLAYRGLSNPNLPEFAVQQLKTILQSAWNEKAIRESAMKFAPGELLVAVSGGRVVFGGAPMSLIQRKVDEIGRIVYRVVEMLLDRPFRERGAPDEFVQRHFEPWLFHAPAGSYQFAVRVQTPEQMTLFDTDTADVSQVTTRLMNIVRACAEDPKGKLTDLVPNDQYRNTFVKLSRNLAPTGVSFERLVLRTPSESESEPLMLTTGAREMINAALRSEKPSSPLSQESKITMLRGVLRGLQLDKDWIEIRMQDESPIRIYDAGDAIDDLIGPMVNQRVVVETEERSNKFIFRDIQIED